MGVYQALLDGIDITKQSFSCRHYQVELGNENNTPSLVTLARLDCIPTLAHRNEGKIIEQQLYPKFFPSRLELPLLPSLTTPC